MVRGDRIRQVIKVAGPDVDGDLDRALVFPIVPLDSDRDVGVATIGQLDEVSTLPGLILEALPSLGTFAI